jgi:hypothetical protein
MEVDRKKLEEILEDLDHDCPKTAAMSVHQILNTNDDTLDFDGYDSALCIDTAIKSILHKHPVSKSTCYEWIKFYLCFYSTILVIKIQCKDIIKEVLNAK